MRIKRSRFNYLVKLYPNHRLYSIGKDKYLEIRTLKYVLRNLLEVFKDILLLPWGLICSIGDFLLEIPDWFKILFGDLKEIFPIGYIKVVDDEQIETIE